MIKKQNYLIITSSVKRAAAIGSGIKLNINQVRHQYSNKVRGNSHKKIRTKHLCIKYVLHSSPLIRLIKLPRNCHRKSASIRSVIPSPVVRLRAFRLRSDPESEFAPFPLPEPRPVSENPPPVDRMSESARHRLQPPSSSTRSTIRSSRATNKGCRHRA